MDKDMNLKGKSPSPNRTAEHILELSYLLHGVPGTWHGYPYAPLSVGTGMRSTAGVTPDVRLTITTKGQTDFFLVAICA